MFNARVRYEPASDVWLWQIENQLTGQTEAMGSCWTLEGSRRKITAWLKENAADADLGGS